MGGPTPTIPAFRRLRKRGEKDAQPAGREVLLDLRRFLFHLRHQFIHLVDHCLHRRALTEVDTGFLQLLHRVIVAAAFQEREIAFGGCRFRCRGTGGHVLEQFGRRGKTGRVLINVKRRAAVKMRNARPRVFVQIIYCQRVTVIVFQ